MNLNEALELLKSKAVLFSQPKTYVEFENHFVFFLQDPNAMDSAYLIDKNKKTVGPYNPTVIPIDEFKNPINKGSVLGSKISMKDRRKKGNNYITKTFQNRTK